MGRPLEIKAKQASGRGMKMASPAWPSPCVSPATGLPGLAESRFLSCFLQNLSPM